MHIMIITGEASGDLHAAEVVAILRKRQPDIRFTGIGGAHLAQQNVSLIHTLDTITCFGFSQALRHYRRLCQILNNIVAGWQHDRPDLLLLVDFGGFNLKLAKHAKEHGIQVFYFIPPKVWAWGRHRTKTMANTITQAAAICHLRPNIYNAMAFHAVMLATHRCIRPPNSSSNINTNPTKPRMPLVCCLVVVVVKSRCCYRSFSKHFYNRSTATSQCIWSL